MSQSPLRFATCNEPWKDVAIEDVFRRAAAIGYDGVEIAPFTLARDVRDISAARRKEIVNAAADAGIEIVGLHWLFVSPEGLHLTTHDASVRQQSAEYLKALVHFCGDLGGKIMVFGSPKQRSITPPSTSAEAWERAREVFAASAHACRERGVTLTIEALTPNETNFINTVDEAARLADEIGHPNIDIMIDMKAMSAMPDGIIGTTQRFGGRARHFHANQPSGKGVGMPASEGDPPPPDLPAVLKSLHASGFQGWVSCEPFDYRPDPDTIARVSLEALRSAAPMG
jgi:sugar phosphate isomerase/epimerase